MRIYTIQHDTLAHVLQFSNITIFDVFPLCHMPHMFTNFDGSLNTSQGIMQNCWLNMICIANFIQPKSHFHFFLYKSQSSLSLNNTFVHLLELSTENFFTPRQDVSFHFFKGSNSSREKLAVLPKVIPAEKGSWQ